MAKKETKPTSKQSNSATLKRMLVCYPSQYYHRIFIAYTYKFEEGKKAPALAGILKYFIDHLDPQERDNLIKFYGEMSEEQLKHKQNK